MFLFQASVAGSDAGGYQVASSRLLLPPSLLFHECPHNLSLACEMTA